LFSNHLKIQYGYLLARSQVFDNCHKWFSVNTVLSRQAPNIIAATVNPLKKSRESNLLVAAVLAGVEMDAIE
jgi:hypothetical protein